MQIDQPPARRPPSTRALAASPLVGITDTNALAARACAAASSGRAEDLFTGPAGAGRSNTFVSAHVPWELDLRLVDVVANRLGLDLGDAERVQWGQIMPVMPVVDLVVGDYLHPRIRPMMNQDRELPKRKRGDINDLGTTALAEFLAPSIIISADSVFTRLGMAST